MGRGRGVCNAGRNNRTALSEEEEEDHDGRWTF
jgi:hypothetical protein